MESVQLAVRSEDPDRLIFDHKCPACNRNVSLRLITTNPATPYIRCRMCEYETVGQYVRGEDRKPLARFEMG